MTRDSDADFLKLRRAVELGWLTPEQVESAIVESDRTPGTNLLERVPLSAQQREALLLSLPPEVAEANRDPANRIGPYVRVAPLGSGGMGRVYKAWDTKLSRWVALKLLRAADDPRARARFEREARLAACLSHPGIASVYEFGEERGEPWIAMQLIDGRILGGAESPVQAASWIRGAARAVAAAHARGVVHRDLKPSNLMLGVDGRVYVLDFGLAKELEEGGSGMSASGALLGTPEYMAPEQIESGSGAAGPATDVYGLGACLYEVLAGRPPFQSESRAEVLLKIVRDEPAPLPRNVPPDLRTIVGKCLEKRPEHRYAGADALAEDLDRFLRGEGIHARRRRRLGLWAKAAGGLTLLAAVALLIVRSVAMPALVPELVTEDARLHRAVRMSRDGDGLVVITQREDAGSVLFRVDPRNGTIRPAGEVNEFVMAVAGTPEGLAVLNPNSAPSTATRIWLHGNPGRTLYHGAASREPIVDGGDLAWGSGRLYVVDQVAGKVHALKLDGSPPTEICGARYAGGFDAEHYNAIAVDGEHVHVADSGLSGVSPPQVVRVPAGGGPPVVMHAGAPLRRPLCVAAGGGFVYVGDTGNTIWRLPVGGGPPTRLVSGPPFVEVASLVHLDGTLYVLDTGNYHDGRGNVIQGPGAVYRIDLR